ncbi:putative oxidoreductase [Hordeum vulgare]|nr:putative oxidoreductase [Hordeum vulgare]
MRFPDEATMAATLYQETEKRPFAFSRCWLLMNGKPKWQQIMTDIKTGKKRNDGSSSHQFIGLDDDNDDVVVTKGKATVRHDNRLLVRTKWEKEKLPQRERMKWDRTKAHGQLEIEREKIDLKKQEAAIK